MQLLLLAAVRKVQYFVGLSPLSMLLSMVGYISGLLSFDKFISANARRSSQDVPLYDASLVGLALLRS
jgi:hypothetical protein